MPGEGHPLKEGLRLLVFCFFDKAKITRRGSSTKRGIKTDYFALMYIITSRRGSSTKRGIKTKAIRTIIHYFYGFPERVIH